MPLFWRIFLLNAVVLIVATVLLLGPVTVSTPVLLTEAFVLTVGLAAMLGANVLLLRVGLAPLQRVTRAMSTTDLLRSGPRPEVTGRGEIAELISTYNTMLDRLEDERAASSARALSAQEDERRRTAQELHDEVGQSLTAVLLQLERVADRDLVEACRATMRGEPFLCPGAVNALIRNYLELARDGRNLPAKAITDREEEILKLVAEGNTSQQIADLLVISPKTVERHRAILPAKLDLKDRLELTRYAIRVGLIEP
ncbi:LuxR C-terminal-related transcriptional regulator [Streptomyces sp. KMM 9044]|uniref:LuxR C-terminal-related transcriptional regulator n=1 Tax=Streptomyces sp. KMM 9044 TaxID=2744474 RepID=UPI002150C3D5|nr:LuxR C-terminal-related transcriptional regulator [Streptomyces sp. KMM 9044]WAX79248.1 LuxR C-terminal-related transcriptional regulator [Streptomyces sp. KMM 9044]